VGGHLRWQPKRPRHPDATGGEAGDPLLHSVPGAFRRRWAIPGHAGKRALGMHLAHIGLAACERPLDVEDLLRQRVCLT
jgi:hypothetical protein